MYYQFNLFESEYPDQVIKLSERLKKFPVIDFCEDYSIWSHVPQYGFRYSADFKAKKETAAEISNLVNSSSDKDIKFTLYCSYVPWLNEEYPYMCNVYSIFTEYI